VFQLVISWLNDEQLLNILAMFVTFDVFQQAISSSNEVLFEKRFAILVIFLVFQVLIGPLVVSDNDLLEKYEATAEVKEAFVVGVNFEIITIEEAETS
jgi:hypothetical protein